MKLAFTLFKYFPFGGLQKDMLRIAEASAARGHQVTIVTSSWEGDKPKGKYLKSVKASFIGYWLSWLFNSNSLIRSEQRLQLLPYYCRFQRGKNSGVHIGLLDRLQVFHRQVDLVLAVGTYLRRAGGSVE